MHPRVRGESPWRSRANEKGTPGPKVTASICPSMLPEGDGKHPGYRHRPCLCQLTFPPPTSCLSIPSSSLISLSHVRVFLAPSPTSSSPSPPPHPYLSLNFVCHSTGIYSIRPDGGAVSCS